jgi:hypothetical protein
MSTRGKSSDWWKSLNNDNAWYLVGLIATDGCLSPDKRHIEITAKDRDFLESIRLVCGIPNKVTPKRGGKGQISHRLQISSRSYYDFLLNVGLKSRKSLRLSKLNVPRSYFRDFLRGVIDGDGCIRTWKHPSNGVTQWMLKIISASPPFIEWIKECCESCFKVRGKIHSQPQSNVYVLKYGKLAAQRILNHCYHDGVEVVLDRKMRLAQACCDSERGWSRSKTFIES